MFIQLTISFQGSKKPATFNINNITAIYEDKVMVPLPKTSTYLDTVSGVSYEVLEGIKEIEEKIQDKLRMV